MDSIYQRLVKATNERRKVAEIKILKGLKELGVINEKQYTKGLTEHQWIVNHLKDKGYEIIIEDHNDKEVYKLMKVEYTVGFYKPSIQFKEGGNE